MASADAGTPTVDLVMSSEFFADIYLLPTEAGGRHGPLVSGEWRTVLGINNEHWSARLTFTGRPLPGDTFHAGVQLLVPEAALPYFTVGAEFTVWEAGTKGTGRVVSVAT
jgi:hypothetical protein